MSCPICGANCRCKKRGEGGICCSCHKHKVGKKMKADFIIRLEGLEGEAQVAKFRELHAQALKEWERCTFCHALEGQPHKDTCPLSKPVEVK